MEFDCGSNSVAFTDGPAIGELKVFVAQGPVVISDWTLTLMDASTVVGKVWVLVRYIMK
jgi:hypothetical protein